MQRKNTDFSGFKKACQDVIGGYYLKRYNFITLFDAHLHITSNSVIVSDFNSVFIYWEIKKNIGLTFWVSFTFSHKNRSCLQWLNWNISKIHIYNQTVHGLYLLKVTYDHYNEMETILINKWPDLPHHVKLVGVIPASKENINFYDIQIISSMKFLYSSIV